MPLAAQYAGPAILTRGEAPTTIASPQITFRPFVSVSAVYDTGLALADSSSQAQLGSATDEGLQFSAGVSGVHTWKRAQLGVTYSGSLTRYKAQTAYGSATQSLMLGLQYQFSRHISMSLREGAGEYSQSYNTQTLSQTATFDPSSGYTPNSDFYDNRTIYNSSQVDVTVNKSRRLSFNMGGDFFLNRRRSTALYGMVGAGARGDIQYRLTRSTTVGAGYTYTKYTYHGIFSGTDVHSWVGSFSTRLSKNWEGSVYAGVSREETKFVQQFAIDPSLVYILGSLARSAIVHSVQYLATYNGRLSYSSRRGVVSGTASHSVTPGNGLFLTSTATQFGVGYGYNGIRHWSIGLSASQVKSQSIGNVIGEYSSASGSLSVSRQLWNTMHLVSSFSVRNYSSGSFTGYNRLIYSATLGFGFAPGAIPLRVW